MEYRPQFYRITNETELDLLDRLKRERTPQVFNAIRSQLEELILCRNPTLDVVKVRAQEMVNNHLAECATQEDQYGVWVYYPWKNQLVQMLDEAEFVEVRTNRNKLKITQEEQDLLKSKKVGIIGLSVGRAVATTIALERVAGEIHLADMDTIELSNLNRIKTPLTELGKNKAISAAREIAEIDPFIKITCFCDGYNDADADDFFTLGGQIDMLIEECDDIGVKIKARQKAKALGIPVIMETNDNCVVDIERYDLDPELLLFNGKLSQEDMNLAYGARSITEKTNVLSKLFDFENITERMKLSIPEFGKTVRTWPQLGSEVIYGSGITAALVRIVLLGDLVNFERAYFGLQKQLNISSSN